MHLPVVETSRLCLMKLCAEQSARLAELGNDPVIAAFTASMPSPYTTEAAHEFIARSALAIERDLNYVFGIHRRPGELIGVLNVRPQQRHRSGHIGYWIGSEFRNQGFATEAVQAAMGFGFCVLNLNRIHTACMANNHASARVLEKAGFELEGRSREAFLRDEVFHDLLQFGTTKDPWQQKQLSN